MDQESDEPETLPLFCVRTTEKRSGQTLYINLKSSDAIQEPNVDIEEEKLIQEICNPSPRIEQFKVPLRLSQIFWSKIDNGDQTDSDKRERHYVIDIELNDKFALRRVVTSDVIRHYLVTVTMASIEEKFNQAGTSKLINQYIGHKIELDQAGYEILDSKSHMERSNEPVNNKILLVESPSTREPAKVKVLTASPNSPVESSYDLYLRPKSLLLTCSIQTDTCPNSISFNDDRIRVELGDKFLLDAYLPLSIDLDVPAKYKFDDRLSLFRIVFKLKE